MRRINLQRFIEAQDGVIERALDELRDGRKQSHWMWFVFPQIEGLGRSPTAQRYAITSLDEARAYLAHSVLGERLEEAVAIINGLGTSDPVAVFGSVDAMKLRSSLTLFREAGGGPAFQEAIDKYFGGEPDRRTLDLLGR